MAAVTSLANVETNVAAPPRMHQRRQLESKLDLREVVTSRMHSAWPSGPPGFLSLPTL